MGDQGSQTITQEIRSDLSVRITSYKLLLLDYETPLFHNELLDAIKLHEEALQRPEPTPAERGRVVDQLGVLDKMNDRLDKHWRELQKSMNARVTLLANIATYQRYLGLLLLLDYIGKHAGEYQDWAATLVRHIDNVTGGIGSVDEDFRLYQQTIVCPIREMMLDREHVERRLRAAARGSTHPAGEFHRMIDECDWPSLALALVNDRKLAATLFGAKQLNEGFWKPETGKLALEKIDSMRDKYFTELSTPTKYTLSRRARDLSLKKAARDARRSSSPPATSPASDRHAEESPAVAAAKGVCNKVFGGLGLARAGVSLRSIVHRGSTATAPEGSLGSTTQLIDSKEKAG